MPFCKLLGQELSSILENVLVQRSETLTAAFHAHAVKLSKPLILADVVPSAAKITLLAGP